MKKIPTLFERKFESHEVKEVLPTVHPGMEWVLQGEGVATEKFDGACCAILDGAFYKRYDIKKRRKMPADAILCQEAPDPITGHFPCWVPCVGNDPADKWFWAAYDNTSNLEDGTYEAVGPHFRANPYNLEEDTLIFHGRKILEVERSFDGIRQYLTENEIEGIVFWKDDQPQCKIKRSDFGLPWGRKDKK